MSGWNKEEVSPGRGASTPSLQLGHTLPAICVSPAHPPHMLPASQSLEWSESPRLPLRPWQEEVWGGCPGTGVQSVVYLGKNSPQWVQGGACTEGGHLVCPVALVREDSQGSPCSVVLTQGRPGKLG